MWILFLTIALDTTVNSKQYDSSSKSCEYNLLYCDETAEIENSSKVTFLVQFAWPMKENLIKSIIFNSHNTMHIEALQNTNILAPHKGKIIHITKDSVEIECVVNSGEIYIFKITKLKKINVKLGQIVLKEEALGIACDIEVSVIRQGVTYDIYLERHLPKINQNLIKVSKDILK